MIKCPNCSGLLNFEPGMQKIECQYCGSTFTAEELEAKESSVSVQEAMPSDENSYNGRVYNCKQCGASIMTFEDTAVTFCSYCGSQAMIEDKMVNNHADYIIPFSIQKEDCLKAYKTKLNKFWFAPDYMKSDYTISNFRGIYMPYGIISLGFDGRCVNMGKTSHRSGDYIIYDEYRIQCDAKAEYTGMSFDLLSNFYDKYSMAIPFNYNKAIPFNQSYLLGYYADAANVDANVYEDTAKKMVASDVSKRMRSASNAFAIHGCPNPTIDFNILNSKVGLFPVYFLGIRHTKNNTISYAVVNGDDGKMAIDLPIDFSKYLVVSLVLAIIIFLILDMFLVLTPSTITIISTVFAIICFAISKKQVSTLKKAQNFEDDLGLSYIEQEKNKDNASSKKKKKTGYGKFLVKEIIAMIIPIFILFSGTIDDELYYGSAIISLILIVLSFSDIIKEHNLLSTHKLPQLEKRGGDL